MEKKKHGEWIGELDCPGCKQKVKPDLVFYDPKVTRFGGPTREERIKVVVSCPKCGGEIATIKGFAPLGFRLR